MNISHEWLKAFVPHALKAEKVAELLTEHVATVEGLERTRKELEPFVVAQVVASEKIPETRLSFNKVDDGSGELLEVVCGAPNVTVGAKYPFARSGTTMPAGFTIEKKKIRGFTSNGMLCSPRELGLGEDHDGIMTLETKAAPGTPFLDVLDLGDTRIVVDVLPNRPDLLSHIGVARELSAITGKPIKLPPELAGLPKAPKPVRGNSSVKAAGVSVKMHDWSDCGRYVGVIIRGVRVGASPEWLKARVESVGGRSISNVVDATNYILHGYGQPVHAFDLAKLGGSAIVVRRAKAGETITTLDGAERKLDPAVLVIADASVPTAIAGIMGGRASEVTEATTDILLEVATFAPKVVRAGRKLLGMNTDASYRYERGIDDASVPSVALVAAGLIARVAGGTIEALLDAGFVPKARKAVALNPVRVDKLLGDKVPPAETTKLLKSIGFAVAKSGASLKVTPPSWRHDVSRDVDLIEDVARLRGYDKLPGELRGARPGNVPDHPLHTLSGRIRTALVARGLFEARPSPYTAGMGKPLVRVINPLGDDEPFLRDSLLHTLGRRAEYNLSRMNGDVRLFEIGTAFIPASDGIVREEIRVGALVMGSRRPRHFSEPNPPAIDAWDAKGIAEAIVGAAWPGAACRLDAEGTEAPVLWRVLAGEKAVGTVESVGLDAPVWASAAFGIEIVLGEMSAVPAAPRGKHNYSKGGPGTVVLSPVRYRALPSTPAAMFDLALIVPDAVSSAQVAETLRKNAGETLEAVQVFDEYRGEGVPAGSRSLAWQLTFRHPERTLSAKEIDGRRAQLIKTLQQELGIGVRTS